MGNGQALRLRGGAEGLAGGQSSQSQGLSGQPGGDLSRPVLLLPLGGFPGQKRVCRREAMRPWRLAPRGSTWTSPALGEPPRPSRGLENHCPGRPEGLAAASEDQDAHGPMGADCWLF